MFRFVNPPITGVMAERILQARMAGDRDFRLARRWCDLGSLGPYLPVAALASEDQRFLDHYGFDTVEIARAMEDAEDGERMRGASTVSQQVAKNLFLWTGRSWLRKGFEVYFTGLVELVWPKRRILEVYLNIIEWGPNVYGVGEAARFYFDKSPDELSLSESIFMASLIPSPKYYRYRFDAQGNLKPHVLNFINMVSNRLVIREKISQAEAESLQVNVQLKGPAMNVFVPLDSLEIDSTLLLPLH